MSGYYWKVLEGYTVGIDSDHNGTAMAVNYPDGWTWHSYYPELVWDGGDYGNGPFTVEARSSTANGNLEHCAKMIEAMTGEIVSTVPYELPPLDVGVWIPCGYTIDDPADEWFAENPWDFEVKPTSAYHNLDGVDVITPLRDDNGNLIGLEVIPSEDHVSTSDSCKTLARWFDVDVSVYPGTYANG